MSESPEAPVARQRRARTPRTSKKKNHSKTAVLFAVSIILALANLLLLVKLGVPLR